MLYSGTRRGDSVVSISAVKLYCTLAPYKAISLARVRGTEALTTLSGHHALQMVLRPVPAPRLEHNVGIRYSKLASTQLLALRSQQTALTGHSRKSL